MADLLRDRELLTTARYIGTASSRGPRLETPPYAILKAALIRAQQGRTNWSRISRLGRMNWQRGLTVGGVVAALGSAAWV